MASMTSNKKISEEENNSKALSEQNYANSLNNLNNLFDLEDNLKEKICSKEYNEALDKFKEENSEIFG